MPLSMSRYLNLWQFSTQGMMYEKVNTTIRETANSDSPFSPANTIAKMMNKMLNIPISIEHNLNPISAHVTSMDVLRASTENKKAK